MNHIVPYGYTRPRGGVTPRAETQRHSKRQLAGPRRLRTDAGAMGADDRNDSVGITLLSRYPLPLRLLSYCPSATLIS